MQTQPEMAEGHKHSKAEGRACTQVQPQSEAYL